MKKKNIMIFPIILLIILLITLILYMVFFSKSNNKPKNVKTIEEVDFLSSTKVASSTQLIKGVKINVGVEDNNSTAEDTENNDSKESPFYVVGNDEVNITLLPVDNLEKSTWSDTNNLSGPVNALKKLNELTSSWTNLQVIDSFFYNDYGMERLLNTNQEYDPSKEDLSYYNSPGGYENISINQGVCTLSSIGTEGSTINTIGENFKVRLATLEEVKKMKLSSWLIEGLKDGEGYWLLTSSTTGKDHSANAYAVFNESGKAVIKSVSVKTELYLRPVIVVSKESLS